MTAQTQMTAQKSSLPDPQWSAFPWLYYAYQELLARVARLGSVDAGGHNVHALDADGHQMNNPRIVEYFKATSYHAKDENKPWCSAFANWCMTQAGYKGSGLANARSWLEWKEGISLHKPVPGAVAVFARGATTDTGHVAFVWKVRQDGSFDVLGGNQGGHKANVKRHLTATSSHVSISNRKKGSAIGLRWPKGLALPGASAGAFLDVMTLAVPRDLLPDVKPGKPNDAIISTAAAHTG